MLQWGSLPTEDLREWTLSNTLERPGKQVERTSILTAYEKSLHRWLCDRGSLYLVGMDHATDFAFDLLDRVRAKASASFTGLGLIFYVAPLRLPVAALGDESLFQPVLPVEGVANIADVLVAISSVASLWHDGFHLVDVRAGTLTHVCQFLAPPPEVLPAVRRGMLPIGARQMAALAGSRIESVACAALLSDHGGPLVFRKGAAVTRPMT